MLNVWLEISEISSQLTVPENLEKHFLPKGCNSCYHTGYIGRKAIYEILPITSELIEFIKTNKTNVDEYVENQKIETLKSNAIKMIKDGETSIEEVFSLLMV